MPCGTNRHWHFYAVTAVTFVPITGARDWLCKFGGVRVRIVQYVFSRHSRLLIGALLLISSAWLVFHASNQWGRVWQVHNRPARKHPAPEVMDADIANDPAMQATKAKVVGPMATLLEKYPAEGAPPTEAESPAADTESAVPNTTPFKSDADRVYRVDYKPLRVFEGKLSVGSTRTIHFQVPPHVNFPKLIGNYSAPDSIEILLMEGEHYQAFRAGDEVPVLLRSESSIGEVNIALRATLNQEREYYLVFRNPSRQPRSLRGNFTLTFE